MKAMRDMHEQGLVTDDYMRELEEAHKRDHSLAAFEDFLREQSGKPDNFYRASGGNKKRTSVAKRIAKRKAQKAARRRARA